ncbi:hypothetical protein OPQ81_006074 [Rhizoctonia solani]|nr:hypothetical protein OPQ81_006074 [Rhizoctonia solani]
MDLLYDEKRDLERSSSDIKKESGHYVRASAAAVDDALWRTMRQAPSESLTPEVALKLRKKIDKHLLPLMMILYWIQFMDKTTLGNSAILDIRTDTHLDTNEPYELKCLQTFQLNLYPSNWLQAIFYIAYLVFEYPQNFALQCFPVGKWMSLNITCWGIALILHAACKNFGGLMACRIILGICEGLITAGLMITTSVFISVRSRVLKWDIVLMNGTALIICGFLSFGGIVTLVTAVTYFMWFPDSPATAWFLNPEERMMAIERIKVNQTGVENKVWKSDQFVEALTDYKTWLFALFSCLGTIPNSLTNQRSIIINSFGFTTAQTTLLACVDRVVEIITIYTGVLLASKWKDGRG